MAENKIPAWVALVAGAIGTYFVTDYLRARDEAKQELAYARFRRIHGLEGEPSPIKNPSNLAKKYLERHSLEEEKDSEVDYDELQWEILGSDSDDDDNGGGFFGRRR